MVFGIFDITVLRVASISLSVSSTFLSCKIILQEVGDDICSSAGSLIIRQGKGKFRVQYGEFRIHNIRCKTQFMPAILICYYCTVTGFTACRRDSQYSPNGKGFWLSLACKEVPNISIIGTHTMFLQYL